MTFVEAAEKWLGMSGDKNISLHPDRASPMFRAIARKRIRRPAPATVRKSAGGIKGLRLPRSRGPRGFIQIR